jgi:hypothetical protein
MIHPIETAMNKAIEQVDTYVLAAPRACSGAVADLVGGRCWGAASFDHGPLLFAYLASVRMLAKAEVPDPGEIVGRLLDACVAKAKETEHPAFVHSVKETNPVVFLAGLLDLAAAEFVEWWPLEHAEWAAAEIDRIGSGIREHEPN